MKYFLKRLLAFIGLGVMIVLSFFYLNLYFGNQSAVFTKVVLVVEKKPEIIVLGSSVNNYYTANENDVRSVSEMLEDTLKTKMVLDISHPAFQSDIYLDIINFCKVDIDSSLFIVPINLRYFSPLWDLRPEYQFIDEKYFFRNLPHYINFMNFQKMSKNEFEKTPIFFDEKKIGNVGGFDRMYLSPDMEKKKGFISSYMQPIEQNNNKLVKLIEILKCGKENNLKILFYITPIDYRCAQSNKIKGFDKCVQNNIKVILNAMKGAKVLDFSHSLNSDYFDYDIRPNEHLNMMGRRFLANELAVEIQKYN